MFYPQEIVDQVIEANNIVDVIGSYVKLAKKGSTYFGLCPFHSEKTPSFSVTDNGAKQMYYCFGCHKGGNVLTFIMKYENASYVDALKQLADRAGIALPKPDYSAKEAERARRREQILAVNKDAALYFYHLLKSERGARALSYFTERGLTAETIKNFGLGYSDKYRDDLYRYLKGKNYPDDIIKASGLVSVKETDTHDYFWNRVMFPIMDVRGKVVAFGGRVMGEGEPKYLNSPETECFNKRRTLYGLHAAKRHKGKEMILCEGYMDVIALHQAGFTNAVASLGTAFTDGHAGVLKRYTDHVVISYDADTAGQDAALRAIPKLRESGISVKVADLRPYKDPDELIRAEGEASYRERLKNAMNSVIFEINCLKASFDLSDPDENTRFFNETAKKLSSFTDGVERENYVRAVSEKFDLAYDLLKEKTKRYTLNSETVKTYEPVRPLKTKKEEQNKALHECEKQLLTYLAQDSSLYDRVQPYLDEHDFDLTPYDQIARFLFDQLRKGKFDPVSIISSFEEPQDQEEAAAVVDARTDNEMMEEEQKRFINECVIRLKKNSIEKQMKEEQDLNKMIALRNELEKIQKIDVFERSI